MDMHEKVRDENRQICVDGLRDMEILLKIVNMAKNHWVTQQEKYLPFVLPDSEGNATRP